MKITGMQTFVVANQPGQGGGPNFVFLKLTTDEGIVGYGEPSFMKLKEKSTVALMEEMFDFAVRGSDPFDIERLWRTLYTGDHFFQHADLSRVPAISAFEMACWDIMGKALNQPIYNLMGGKYNDKLRAYTYLYGWRTGDPPELAAERALYYLDLGFTSIGFDPVMPTTPNPRPISLEQLDYVEAVVGAVRKAVGNKMDIQIKTHGQLSTQAAIRLARRVEQFDPLWFEEPVPLENMDEMAKVARATSIPIATGERLTTKYEFANLLEAGAATILQPALGAVGGLMEAKKIAGIAETRYAHIAPWMHTGPIAGAASIQLGVCSPNFLIIEGIETWGGMQAEILMEPVKWEKGYIIPSGKPGLGVELNEEVAKRNPYAAK